MKIIHIFHNYWPVIGGLENAVKALAEEQAKLGHEVHVITSIHGAEGRPKEEVVNNVSIHRVKATRLMGYPDLTIPLEYPNTLKDTDIILTYSHNSLFNYLMAEHGKQFNEATLTTYFIGVDYLKNHYNPIIRTFGYKYEKHITRKFIKITDIALTTNKCEAEILKENYGIDSTVIPHGIHELLINKPYEGNLFREKFNIQGELITYLGRLHPTKGIDLLLKAFSMIKGLHDDIYLVIAGTGTKDYVNYLRKTVDKLGLTKYVYFLGYVNESDKAGLIDASRFLVLPTRHAGESYPMVINEAAARGKPIIVNKIGCAWTIELANIIPTEPNERSLAEIMTKLLDNKYYNVLITNINNVKPPTWSKVARRLIELWT